MEKGQRRFAKMIVTIEGLSCEERLRCLKLWTLEERRNREDLMEIFKTSQEVDNTTSRLVFTG